MTIVPVYCTPQVTPYTAPLASEQVCCCCSVVAQITVLEEQAGATALVDDSADVLVEVVLIVAFGNMAVVEFTRPCDSDGDCVLLIDVGYGDGTSVIGRLLELRGDALPAVLVCEVDVVDDMIVALVDELDAELDDIALTLEGPELLAEVELAFDDDIPELVLMINGGLEELKLDFDDEVLPDPTLKQDT